MMYLLYDSQSGQAVSFGSVLADPMPTNLILRELTDNETNGVFNGDLKWDAATLTFVQNLHWVPSDV